jgi:hypothetical protein
MLPFPEHLDEAGDDLGRVPLVTVAAGPIAGLERPFDLDQRALDGSVAEDLGLLSEKNDAVPLGGFLPLAGLGVLPA